MDATSHLARHKLVGIKAGSIAVDPMYIHIHVTMKLNGAIKEGGGTRGLISPLARGMDADEREIERVGRAVDGATPFIFVVRRTYVQRVQHRHRNGLSLPPSHPHSFAASPRVAAYVSHSTQVRSPPCGRFCLRTL